MSASYRSQDVVAKQFKTCDCHSPGSSHSISQPEDIAPLCHSSLRCINGQQRHNAAFLLLGSSALLGASCNRTLVNFQPCEPLDSLSITLQLMLLSLEYPIGKQLILGITIFYC